jgi:hypothetical protein
MNLEWSCGKYMAMWRKQGRNHSSAQFVGRIIYIEEVCGVIRIKNADRNLVFSVHIVHFDQNTSSTWIHILNISTAHLLEVQKNCFCSYVITLYDVFVKNLNIWIQIKIFCRTFSLVMCHFVIISRLVFYVITIRLSFCSTLRKLIYICCMLI